MTEATADPVQRHGLRAGVPVAFLSHASADAEVARQLAADLRANGVDVWYDEWEIKAGESLRRKVDAGIDAATHFLVLLTPVSLKSEWVQTELDAAMVKRISGKCRLIPILCGISADDVPATLAGIRWVTLDSYAVGLRELLEACYGVSTKPPLGQTPAWAKERPLDGTNLSATAQRIAVWINLHSEDGTTYHIVDRDTLMGDLGLSAEQAGMAATELEDEGYVQLGRDSGSGPAGFSFLKPRSALFFLTDPELRGWNPARDANELAAAMVNIAQGNQVSLADVDKQLRWGPRRLNPAADYLDVHGLVHASRTMGSAPYTYSQAVVSHRTRRFAQAASG